MGFNPKDAIESVKDIATNAVERSADIVDSAGHILKGDVSEGVQGIVASSMDIATHSVDKVKEIVTGRTEEVDEIIE
jgi:molybdopterin-binding protein